MYVLFIYLSVVLSWIHGVLPTDMQRTVVYIYVNTDLGESVFIRGGYKCANADCRIHILHRRTVTHAQTGAYVEWSHGDNYLDWNGEEPSQSLYETKHAAGTPLIWTTDTHSTTGPTVLTDGYGYSPSNTFGSNFWMMDVYMDCSETYQGWFEFKTYTVGGNTGGWEPDLAQTQVCGGDGDGARPYQSINHMGRCGQMNIFYYANYGCTIINMTNIPHTYPAGACGRRSVPAQRIVGGHSATPGHWPWMLEVMYKGNHGCGAVLISPKWAVTAGHCVRTAKTYGPWATIIRASETNRHSISGKEKDYFVRRIVKHPLFDRVKPNRDIALLEILTPINTESDDVTPACLPVGVHLDSFVGQECWAIGWGSTQGSGDSLKLQEIRMDVSSNKTCSGYYGSKVTLADVCAGLGSIAACMGDSGSPLSCVVNGRWYAVGVVSWGDDGCRGRPSVYSRLSAYTDWIKSETGLSLDFSQSNVPVIG